MRTTAFALLGVTTAMALGLVALVAQQSWHYLPVAPIPGYQAEVGKLDQGIPLPAAAEVAVASRDAPADRALLGGAPAVTGSNESRLVGSHRVSQSAAADPVPAQPEGAGAPAPAPGVAPPDRASDQPLTASPATPPSPSPATPSPTPASPSPSAATPAVVATNPGKGHAYGRQKATVPPKPKPSHPAPTPTAPLPTAEPSSSPAPAAPPALAPGPSDGPGNGHGHAYGHDK